MKKFLSLCLAVLMAFSLVACANTDTNKEPVSPSEEYTDPVQTPANDVIEDETTTDIETPVEEEIEYREEFGVKFPVIKEYEDYAVKEAPSNISDDVNIHLFKMNQKEYNLHEITLEMLKEDEIKSAGYGNMHIDIDGWYHVSSMYGLPNEDGNRMPPVNPIFLDLDEAKENIESVCCSDEDTKNEFYNGLYVGMSEEEAVKLLDGAFIGSTSFDHYYMLKNSTTTLIVKMDDEVVDSITIIKNESMANWNKENN